MNTKTLSTRALSVIDQYRQFTVGSATCSVPYFNNKTKRSRGALRVYVGKGSPKELFEEIQSVLVKAHIDTSTISNETIKKLLTDENIGIDCSGFAYYVLNSQNEEIGKGKIDKHLSFINCHGLIGKMRCALRPIENCDVATFAHDSNSRLVTLKDVTPGDMITMLNDSQENERDHILVIHQVEYQNFIPYQIHYSHAVAYPEDGIYGTGIKQGTIEILDLNKPLTDQLWTENGKTAEANRIFTRAQKSKTEIRRLKWW